MGDLHCGCAAKNPAATVWCYHANMDQSLWRMFPSPCWIYATKIKAALKAKVVEPITNKVYLIKWPGSVCTTMYGKRSIIQNVKFQLPYTVKKTISFLMLNYDWSLYSLPLLSISYILILPPLTASDLQFRLTQNPTACWSRRKWEASREYQEEERGRLYRLI